MADAVDLATLTGSPCLSARPRPDPIPSRRKPSMTIALSRLLLAALPGMPMAVGQAVAAELVAMA
jgi:hypothetical protein